MIVDIVVFIFWVWLIALVARAFYNVFSSIFKTLWLIVSVLFSRRVAKRPEVIMVRLPVREPNEVISEFVNRPALSKVDIFLNEVRECNRA